MLHGDGPLQERRMAQVEDQGYDGDLVQLSHITSEHPRNLPSADEYSPTNKQKKWFSLSELV
jgi:hypothetical protein